MKEVKNNVNVFNKDVELNQGYKYTTNAPFSAVVANKRLTKATLDNLPSNVKTLIDIGCGDGTYTNELKLIRKDLTFAGTDPAEKAIDHAKQNYPDIDFFISNILVTKSFVNKHFDIAVMRGVLHHLSDQEKAIRNTLLLADNMLIIEPNGNNPILKYIEKHSLYHIEHEEQSFTTQKLINWCKDAGWQVSFIKYVGYVPYFFPTFLSKTIYLFQPFLEKIPLFRFFFSAQIIILCKKRHGKHKR
jgi:SAM-dependent methyltransferase